MWANVYYVSPAGDDEKSGDATGPWRRLSYALAHVSAGDTIVMTAGTYSESPVTKVAGTADKLITVDGSNKAATLDGRWTINKPYYRVTNLKVFGTPNPHLGTHLGIVNGPGAYIIMEGSDASHCVIDGCDFSGGNFGIQMALGKTDGVDGATGPAFNVIRNNVFHQPYSNAMIALHGHDNLITQNVFRDNEGWDVFRVWGTNNTISQNTFLRNVGGDKLHAGGNHADIIQTFKNSKNETSSNLLFERNKIIDGTSQFGNLETTLVSPLPNMGNWTIRNNLFIRSRFQLNNWLPNVKVYNNTFYDSVYPIGIAFIKDKKGSADNGRVCNNLFVCVGSTRMNGFYGFKDGLSNCIADYNLVTGRAGTAKEARREGSHGINSGGDAHELFVDPDHGDLALKPGSRAIGRGADLSVEGFSDDINGRVRTAPWDIGAYKY